MFNGWQTGGGFRSFRPHEGFLVVFSTPMSELLLLCIDLGRRGHSMTRWRPFSWLFPTNPILNWWLSSSSYTSFLGHLLMVSSFHFLITFFCSRTSYRRRYSDLLRQIWIWVRDTNLVQRSTLLCLSKRTSFVFKDSNNILSVYIFQEQNLSIKRVVARTPALFLSVKCHFAR